MCSSYCLVCITGCSFTSDCTSPPVLVTPPKGCAARAILEALLVTCTSVILSGHTVFCSAHAHHPVKRTTLVALDLCVSVAPALAASQAPSGSPPDVSSRLLDVCAVADACEGLKIEAVIEAAEKVLKPSGSPGEHRLSGLDFETERERRSPKVQSLSGFLCAGGREGRASRRQVKTAGICGVMWGAEGSIMLVCSTAKPKAPLRHPIPIPICSTVSLAQGYSMEVH